MAINERKARAARNDAAILRAAREVFNADPAATIAAVAQRAGVGMSAMYRRYRSKEKLLQTLALDTIRGYSDIARAALAASSDPWEAFTRFMKDALEAGPGALTLRLASTSAVTDELSAHMACAYEAIRGLLRTAQQAGVLRSGIEVGDISLLLEQLQAKDIGDDERNRQLRRRYLALILDGLHLTTAPALPAQAPSWNEIGARRRTRRGL